MRIMSLLTRSAFIHMPSILQMMTLPASTGLPDLPVVLKEFIKSLKRRCTCFISWMFYMFCSTSCSWPFLAWDTSVCFQFSTSVVLLIAVINCYCMAKMLTCYFLRVSVKSRIPFSQSCASTMVERSLSIILTSQSYCQRVPRVVLMRLNYIIYCST